ncbi:MAG: VOC family protein [Pseudomonadota bacterium]
MKLGYIILYVPDVDDAVEFYERAFGLSRRFIHESGTYAELTTGETTLAFAGEGLAASHGFPFRRQRPDAEPGAFEVALVAEDVAAAHQKAIDAGAVERKSPAEMPWGQTVSYVSDHLGNTVELCTPMAP